MERFMAGSRQVRTPLEEDTLWYKDAIIYELHVRAYHDSDGDGSGEFKGLKEKLGYLQDLGITAIWVLPFCPSPWRDDGYDISDYTNIHPSYGTLRDFHSFVKEAHRRGLRVITELVLNHTSDQHQWFQRSRRAKPGSRARNFYVWSDNPDAYKDARIIFKDFESSNWTWDPVAKAYYWHRFYSHQPDLNFESPHVRRALLETVDFWLDMGVDGLRLDAVPYLFEKEGTSCENLPETHGFLQQLRRHVDSKYSSRMLLAEANQWPEDAVAYFGNGDECHMAFHFPLMPRLFMAYRLEDRFPIIDILQLTPDIPETCQWALFLRNHDELTLEMVTDEERDYMYRVYAQDPQMRINLGIRRRLAPLLGNHRRRIELMNALMFSLPGTPVIYYGDEIGMGDNIYLGDRNGVRTPMQWNGDRNAGFSRTNPQRLFLPVIIDPEYHYEAVNVESQQNNPHSLLWWMKRLIALRKQSKAMSRGSLEMLHPENRRVLAFLREYDGERVLVVANLSRFAQPVSLDLSQCKDWVPVEMFGHIEFPPIAEQPYFMTIAPHTFYWFVLEPPRVPRISAEAPAEQESTPVLTLAAGEDWWQARGSRFLGRHLPAHLRRSRWFRGKARPMRSAEIMEVIPFGDSSRLVMVRVDYGDGEPEVYFMPLTLVPDPQAGAFVRDNPDSVLVRLQSADGPSGVLANAVHDREFCGALLDAIVRRRRMKGEGSEIAGARTRVLPRLHGPVDDYLEPRVQRAEQSNTSIIYGNRLILKLFRHVESGINPDLEIGRFLTENTSFRNLPLVAGFLEYRKGGQSMTLGVLQEFVRNQGDAWQYTLDTLGRYFENVSARGGESAAVPSPDTRHPMDLLDEALPEPAGELSHKYCQDIRLLGERTAEMHLALAGTRDQAAFTPEPFTDFYRQSLYHGMLGLAGRSCRLLQQRMTHLAGEVQEEAAKILELEPQIRNRFRWIRDRKLKAARIRHHGDYHLGQVLFTGKDFIIIDFEGEPARPLSERRIKRSPLRDVAGMIRSFHYASWAVLLGRLPGVIPVTEASSDLSLWARFWYQCVCVFFLKGYLERAGNAPFLPQTREDIKVLLDAFLLEKALYEVGYELNNRPDWVRIPMRGILDLVSTGE
jgi:maltose alpha-D-glucosyltransferase/alpha-amylase